MKKINAIAFAAVLTIFGVTAATPAHALTVEDCAESDTAPPECAQFEGVEPNDDGVYPIVAPTTGVNTTVPPEPEPTIAPAPTVPGDLPQTGSDGASGILQIGGLLLVSGLVVFAVARRRSPAAAS